MRKVYSVLFILVISVGLLLLACKKTYKMSRHGESKSHYQGALCQTCHSPGGEAKDVYTVSGTVLDEVRLYPQKKAVIKLYTKPLGKGKLVATLRSDELGNFYTTQKINFSGGLYPTLLGTPGVKDDVKHMKRPLFRADCNWCHGLNEESLGID